MPKKNGTIARVKNVGRSFVTVEADMLDRTSAAIPTQDWDGFQAWINRPAEISHALAELARRIPS